MKQNGLVVPYTYHAKKTGPVNRDFSWLGSFVLLVKHEKKFEFFPNSESTGFPTSFNENLKPRKIRIFLTFCQKNRQIECKQTFANFHIL